MIDWTPIVLAAASFTFAVLKLVADQQINARVKNQADRDILNKALDNSLGAIQQAAEKGLHAHPLQSDDLHVSGPVAVGVQYVLDHAGDEMKRLEITPEAAADKINARLGLNKIVVPVTPFPAPLTVSAGPPTPA